ncbi:MAG: hypothetical protein KC609_14840 [Myxococcales bacterium]|nr:hypothetical protein [Myxococcales bacterium]
MPRPVPRYLQATLALLVFAVACSSEPNFGPGDEQESRYGDVVFMITQKGLDQGSPVRVVAAFVDHLRISASASTRLLRLPVHDLPLDLRTDQCRVERYDLAELAAVDPDQVWIQLQDIGHLEVQSETQIAQLDHEEFPDLFPFIAGVTYRTRTGSGLRYVPGTLYQLIGQGNERVAAFRASVRAPEEFRILAAGFTGNENGNSEPRLRSLSVRWDSGRTTNATLFQIKLTISRSDRVTTLSCRVADDGVFDIPASHLAELRRAGTEAQLVLRRVNLAKLNVGDSQQSRVAFVVEREQRLTLP